MNAPTDFQNTVLAFDNCSRLWLIVNYTEINNDAVYTNAVNLSALPSHFGYSGAVDMSVDELEIRDYTLDYVYPMRELNVTSRSAIECLNDKYTHLDPDAFKTNYGIQIPDSHRWASKLFNEGFDPSISDINCTVEELKGVYGTYYINFVYEITFKCDIDVPEKAAKDYFEYFGKQEPIKKGDTLRYKSMNLIYFQNGKKESMFFTDKLEGMGTNLGNRTKGAYGNYDDLLISISSLTNNAEDKRFSNPGEFENYVFNVVEPKKNQK